MALQWLRSGLRSGVLVAAAVCSGVASTSVTAQEPALQGFFALRRDFPVPLCRRARELYVLMSDQVIGRRGK